MNIENLNKSIVQFVLLLVALACVFIIILGIGLLYDIKKGGLDFVDLRHQREDSLA